MVFKLDNLSGPHLERCEIPDSVADLNTNWNTEPRSGSLTSCVATPHPRPALHHCFDPRRISASLTPPCPILDYISGVAHPPTSPRAATATARVVSNISCSSWEKLPSCITPPHQSSATRTRHHFKVWRSPTTVLRVHEFTTGHYSEQLAG